MRNFFAVMLVSVAILAPGTAQAQLAPLTPLYVDDFNRADGPLGSYWESLPAFGTPPTVSSNQACTAAGSEAVAVLAGTVDPAKENSAGMKVESSDLSSLKFGVIFASIPGGTAPAYTHMSLSRNPSGEHFLQIETNASGSDTVVCSSGTLQLVAGNEYFVSAGLAPDGEARVTFFDLSIPPNQFGFVEPILAVDCNVGAQTRDRIVILSGDENSTAGDACFDDFSVYSFDFEDPACSDGEQNGTETDVDCGGSCSPCNDGHICSVGADCSSGVCGAGNHCESPTCSDGVQNGTETGVDCGGTCDACSVGGCSGAPLAGCRVGTKSSLKLTDNPTDDTKDSFAWGWGNGPDTSYADLGDPTVDAEYQLCIYDGSSAVLLEALVPAAGTCGDKPCWSTKPEKSFTFKDKAGTSDGITSAKLGSGIDGKAKLTVKGKGTNLQDVTLPFDPSVKVRLQNLDSGLCWESTFPIDAIKTNDPEKGKFQAAVKP